MILNATSCGSEAQIDTLVSYGCISILCELLVDSSMVMMAMEGASERAID